MNWEPRKRRLNLQSRPIFSSVLAPQLLLFIPAEDKWLQRDFVHSQRSWGEVNRGDPFFPPNLSGNREGGGRKKKMDRGTWGPQSNKTIVKWIMKRVKGYDFITQVTNNRRIPEALSSFAIPTAHFGKSCPLPASRSVSSSVLSSGREKSPSLQKL